MSRLAGRLRYFLSDAVDEWRHSPGVNLVATATLMAALFIAGLMLLVLSNLAGRIGRLRGEVRVEVYLHDEIPAAAVEALRARLAQMPDVSRVDFVDKDAALRRFRESFGDLADVTGELGTNPLPASLEAFLVPGAESAEAADRISRALAGEEGIEEVRYDRVWLDRLDALLGLARIGGAGVSVLVFGAVVFVMASVLRLAVYARREEIEIMLLVGASPAFVRGPFLVAGVAQGIAAGLASLVMVDAVRRGALAYVGSTPGVLLDLVAGRPLEWTLSALIVAIGLVVSFAGAFFAVRRAV